MSNSQQPTTISQHRMVVAHLLPCVVQATARNRARPIPLFRMGPPPHAFRFAAVSPLRHPPMLRAMSFSFLSRVDRDDAIGIMSSMETQARQPEMLKKPGDLGARTVDYGLAVMELCGRFPQGFSAKHIAGQLVRSATSVAANYAERRRGSMPRRIERIGRGISRATTMRCWLMVAGCWLLDIADAKEDSRTVRRGKLL